MDAVEQHRSYSPNRFGFGVVTVSDSRTSEDDVGGATIRELAAAAGHEIVGAAIVPDEAAAIDQVLDRWLADPRCDVVVFTGGTGFSPRDVTVPTIESRFDATVEGFGELFRLRSYDQIGAAAMLSRATAGVVGRRVIYAVPGSPKAVRLAMEELILPETGHLLGQLRREAAPRRG